MRYPLLVRALVIGGVAASVLIPIALIEGKIAERRALAEGVVKQFAEENSGPQVVAGPLLALTCEEETLACPTAYFAPRVLKAVGNVPVESLRRGIYEIRTYRAALELTGEFDWPSPPPESGGKQRVWKHAYVVVGVSDARGLRKVTSTLSSHPVRGRGENNEEKLAVRDELGEYSARRPGSALPFAYRIELVGASSLNIAPVGDSSEIRMSSNWPHPSFIGGSPDERQVTSLGFDSVWRSSHLATGGQAHWSARARAGILTVPAAGAGVAFFDPVNVYALSYRATQYAFLFVLFTFAALALTEVLAGVRLHAIQYALVGSAIAVFFLLLIALSEHFAFDASYAAAAGACVLLLTFYLRHPLGTFARATAFFALFVGLYAALYVLLKSEDHALLLGSAMVFAVLAVTMVATRKLDWSAVAARMGAGSAVSDRV